MRISERNLASESADDLLGAIERGERSRALLAWLPLMHGADDPGIIERWKVAAEAEPDDRRRSELAGLAKVFAQVPDRWVLWSSALKEWNMKRSIAVEEWKAEGRAEGRADALVEVLEDRFGPLPPELAQSIRATSDIAVLRGWQLLAGRAADLAAFRAQAGV